VYEIKNKKKKSDRAGVLLNGAIYTISVQSRVKLPGDTADEYRHKCNSWGIQRMSAPELEARDASANCPPRFKKRSEFTGNFISSDKFVFFCGEGQPLPRPIPH